MKNFFKLAMLSIAAVLAVDAKAISFFDYVDNDSEIDGCDAEKGPCTKEGLQRVCDALEGCYLIARELPESVSGKTPQSVLDYCVKKLKLRVKYGECKEEIPVWVHKTEEGISLSCGNASNPAGIRGPHSATVTIP